MFAGPLILLLLPMSSNSPHSGARDAINVHEARLYASKIGNSVIILQSFQLYSVLRDLECAISNLELHDIVTVIPINRGTMLLAVEGLLRVSHAFAEDGRKDQLYPTLSLHRPRRAKDLLVRFVARIQRSARRQP